MRVRIVEQILNPQQDLLDRNRGFPALIFVQDTKTNRTGGKDVGMEERRSELALGWLAGVFFRKDHAKLVHTAFPWCLSARKEAESKVVSMSPIREERERRLKLTFALPGMPTSQFIRSSDPSAAFAGRA